MNEKEKKKADELLEILIGEKRIQITGPKEVLEDYLQVKDKEEAIVILHGSMIYLNPPLDFSCCGIKINDYKELSVKKIEELKKQAIEIVGQYIIPGNGCLILPVSMYPIHIFNFFNHILGLLNILGLPISFIEMTDIVYLGEWEEKPVQLRTSRMAYDKILHIPSIEITEEQYENIIKRCNFLHDKIKANQFLVDSKVYDFLAKANYAYYNKDFRTSFFHFWIFIEALINKIWESEILKKYSKSKADEIFKSKNWTMQTKTVELYLLGILTKNEAKIIDEIRKKRNAVFHFDIKKEKREVLQIDCAKCFDISMTLFYREIGVDYKKDIIDFPEVRNQIFRYWHDIPRLYYE